MYNHFCSTEAKVKEVFFQNYMLLKIKFCMMIEKKSSEQIKRKYETIEEEFSGR